MDDTIRYRLAHCQLLFSTFFNRHFSHRIRTASRACADVLALDFPLPEAPPFRPIPRKYSTWSINPDLL